MFLRTADAVIAKFKDPQIVYMLETLSQAKEPPRSVILRGKDLNFDMDLTNIKLPSEADRGSENTDVLCEHFCMKSKSAATILSVEVSNRFFE